jgi:hypothetical protein
MYEEIAVVWSIPVGSFIFLVVKKLFIKDDFPLEKEPAIATIFLFRRASSYVRS